MFVSARLPQFFHIRITKTTTTTTRRRRRHANIDLKAIGFPFSCHLSFYSCVIVVVACLLARLLDRSFARDGIFVIFVYL